jgi:hypothetical protein
LAADIIGQHGGPTGANEGFAIQALPTQSPVSDFAIGAGRYYVDGILCEADPAIMPVTFASASGTVTLLNLAEAGIQFNVGDFVEVFDDVPQSSSSQLFSIQQIDTTGTILTLAPAPTLNQPLTNPKIRRVFRYLDQPDCPPPTDGKIQIAPGISQTIGRVLVYLDVWERHIASLQDQTILEVALGGPDTAARAKIVCQIKTIGQVDGLPGLVNVENDFTDANWDKWIAYFQPADRGLLKAQVQPQQPSTDPCILSPESRYHGAENQLYRLEIHTGSFDRNGGSASPSFKWSRENGSVLLPILKISSDMTAKRTTLTMANLGRDDRLSVSVGDWTEIADDDSILANRAEPLLKVLAIDRTAMTVTLDGIPTSNTVGTDKTKHPILRRWDQTEGDPDMGGVQLGSDGTVPIPTANPPSWLTLEDGIQVQFQIQPAATYRTGDYWLIPARTSTGDVEWPRLTDESGNLILDANGQPVAQALPPHGVEHHYAPIAFLTLNQDGTLGPGNVTDLRRTFATQAT